MERVFLDANVLFSAAYREGAGLAQLWERRIGLVTSEYALQEAARNLPAGEVRQRLHTLVASVEVIPHSPRHAELAAGIDLPDDDRPILGAAVATGAGTLLSGDRRAFGRYYGTRVVGVLVLRPAEYLLRG